MTTYTCPVCGYNRLRFSPDDYTICPSCGTQFGYTDARRSHEQLQAQWLASGAPWHSRVVPRPENWDAAKQVAAIIQPLKSDSTATNTRDVDLSRARPLVFLQGVAAFVGDLQQITTRPVSDSDTKQVAFVPVRVQ